jgi:hypothetical protein
MQVAKPAAPFDCATIVVSDGLEVDQVPMKSGVIGQLPWTVPFIENEA